MFLNFITTLDFYLVATLLLFIFFLFVYVYFLRSKILKCNLNNKELANVNNEIINKIPIGTSIYDKNGLLISFNEASCRIFGTRNEDVSGKISIQDNPNFSEDLIEAFKNKKEIIVKTKYDFNLVNKNSYFSTVKGEKKRWLNLHGVPIIGSNGDLIYYILFICDIQHKEVWRQNQTSLFEALQTVLKTLNYAIYFANISKGIFEKVSTNNESFDLFDKEIKKIKDKNDKNSREKKRIKEYLDGTKDSGKGSYIFYDEKLKINKTYTFSEYVIPGRYSDDVCLIVLVRDSAEALLKESKTENLDKAIRLGIGASRINVWNYNVLSKKVNILLGDTVQGKKNYSFREIIRYVHEEDRVIVQDFQHKCENACDNQVAKAVFRMYNNKNECRYFKATTRIRKDEGGNFIYLYGLLQDVDKLVKAKQDAELANKIKSNFLANMSHEIRTPLNAIVGFSGMLISEDLDKDTKDSFVNIIETNNELLLTIINDILDYSTMEAGMLKLEDVEFDFEKSFDDLYKTLNAGNNKRENVELINEHPKGEFIIKSDKNRIFQIISNLVFNAIKFTHSGSVIMSYNYDDDKKNLLLKVKDTGVGISDDKQGSMFVPFAKIDTFAQGAGLGLPICKEIVASFNGKIKVNSKVGEGTEFLVSIPCEKVI